VTVDRLAVTAPLGGWEAPDNELRGHYVGHYLSACALIWASAGDAQVRQRGDEVVAALAECPAPPISPAPRKTIVAVAQPGESRWAGSRARSAERSAPLRRS
jgi:Beta-L-arabinofuranosidase, GH127